MAYWYGLDGQPINAAEAGELMHSPERILAKTLITTDRGRAEISTVFLIVDHRILDEGPPVLWQTTVFGSPMAVDMLRYNSKADAIAGHHQMVDLCRHALEADGATILATEGQHRYPQGDDRP